MNVSTTNLAVWTAETDALQADALLAPMDTVQVSARAEAFVGISADGDDQDGDGIPDSVERADDHVCQAGRWQLCRRPALCTAYHILPQVPPQLGPSGMRPVPV